MAVVKSRGWYWKVYGDQYKRFKVGDLPKFCGWEVLLKLVKECENTPYYQEAVKTNYTAIAEVLRRKLIMRDQALIATAFETGGRISEVLALKKENFTVLNDRILVTDMPVVKRFRKVKEIVEVWQGEEAPEDKRWHWSHKYDNWVRVRWKTEPEMDRRNVLEIPRFEPLTPYIVKWLNLIPDGWLFTGYSKRDKPMTDVRAYQIVRSVGERLGLKICCHWFRSMRASQLAEEYGFREFELMKFFSWKSDAIARLYAKLAPAKLYEMMSPDRIRVGVKI